MESFPQIIIIRLRIITLPYAMLRLSLALSILLTLASCDCEPGPTRPHAFVQNYIIAGEAGLVLWFTGKGKEIALG